MMSCLGQRARPRMRAAAAARVPGGRAQTAAGRGLLVLACVAARGSALHSASIGLVGGGGLIGDGGLIGGGEKQLTRLERLKTQAYGWSSWLESASAATKTNHVDGQGYRQKMQNVEDMQYVSYLSLGGQTLAGIMDTGSSEVVVFPKSCSTCGTAAGYDPTASQSHGVGNMTQRWNYESGTVDCVKAWDLMTVGLHRDFNQTFWEATKTEMELLFAASFQAIIGLSPPKVQPAAAAAAVDGLKPESYGGLGLLTTTRERAFSICLQKDRQSDGYFVWNDTSAVLHPELFHRVPVIGDGSWSVRATNARFSFLAQLTEESDNHTGSARGVEHLAFENSTSMSLGCEEGCSFMLDSGTSVLGMPGEVATQLAEIVGRADINCSNMWELPFLTFELNGQTFSLPPSAYLAQRVSDPEVPSFLQDIAEVRMLGRSTSSSLSDKRRYCQLGVIAVGSKKKAGPLWVLGMPFFRKYYTSFTIGTGPEDHAIHVAGQSEQCTPGYRSVEVHNGPAKLWQHTVDPSKLIPKGSTHSGSGMQFVSGMPAMKLFSA